MSKSNEELSGKLVVSGAQVTPSSVVGGMKHWFYGDGKNAVGKFSNIAELCGSEEDAKRLFVVTMTYITNAPYLMKVDQKSLQQCIMQSATLGLLPGVMAECDYIPFKNVAKFCPGYRGLVKLAVQGGTVIDVSANVVYEKDTFDYEEGTAPRVTYKKFLGPQNQRGNRVCVYAIARMHNGMHKFVLITPDHVMSVKAKSQAANSDYSPWNSKSDFDQDAMWCKTAVKQLTKLIPMSTKALQLARAIQLDNAAERPDLDKGPAFDVVDSDEFGVPLPPA